MPKILQCYIGSVFLKEVEPGQWRGSWTDPRTKKHIRRLLPVTSYRAARKEAEHINTVLALKKGFGGRLRGAVGHTVRDAAKEAIIHSDANERTRMNYLSRFNSFADYLAEHHSGITAWSSVSEAILQNYLTHCRKQGLAHASIVSRLFVVRMTVSYMARTYPEAYRNVANGLRLKRIEPPNQAAAILSPAEIRTLLKTLKKINPMVHCWALLQSLCGLRLWEAAYLREQDIDFKTNTITVTATSAHEPKTRHSYRTIPIPPVVAKVLSGWIDRLKVRHPEGYLFFPSKAIAGRKKAFTQAARVGALTVDTISHRYRDALQAMDRRILELPEQFIPRKLRASFVTAMRTAKTDFETLQNYIGHAPLSLMAAAYDMIDLDRLCQISSLAQNLFEARGAFKSAPIKAKNG